MHSNQKKFANVVLLEFLKKFSGELYIIALPAIALALETSHTEVQRLLAAFFIGIAVAQVFAGPWSDIIGRRHVLLVLLPVFVVGSLICSLGNLPLIYLGIFMNGLGIGSAPALGKAIIYDLYKHSKIVTNVFVLASAFVVWAPAIAMIVGGAIANFIHWRVIFFMSAGVGVFAFFVTYFLLAETAVVSHKKNMLHSLFVHYWQLLRSPQIIFVLLASGLIASGVIAYYTVSVFIFTETLKIRLHWVGYFAVLIVVSNFGGKVIAMHLVHKLGRVRLVMCGVTVSLIATLIMLVCAVYFKVSVITVVLPMMIYMLGLGATIPSARILLFERAPGQVASCSSLFSIMHALMGALAVYLISHLDIDTALPLAIYLLVLMVLAWLASLIGLRRIQST